MANSIVYCGDTDQNGAAAYLSGLMASWGWKFDYIPSHVRISESQLTACTLLILSDYMASQFDITCQELAAQRVEQGCGLLMIGGWESFHGFGGNWDGTLLGSMLPVEIHSADDRVNFPQSAFLRPTNDHAIVANLPWSQCPPAIGGMNRVIPKSSATVLLQAHSFAVTSESKPGTIPTVDSNWLLSPRETLPALVVGAHGAGRTAAFMSDVAPHWVGGFVDWGPHRVMGQAPNAGAIEVGSDYARFWKQLLEWTAGSRR